jgi:hypothetical protein
VDTFLAAPGLTVFYLALLGVGILYAVIILIGGGLHDLHLPGFDLHGGGHLHIPGGVDQPEVGVPSLSPITIASFVTAFGGFGLIALGLLAADPRWSLLWAAGGGLVVAVIAHFAFGYFFIVPQGSSEVRFQDIVGAAGEVTTPIPAGGLGEVAFVAQGGRVSYPAKSADGQPIARGITIVITELSSGVVVVRPRTPPST